MNSFSIERVETLGEAVELLQRHDNSSLYAGGTELLLVMKQGFLQPDHLIDVKGIDELRQVDVGAERVRIGAGVTHHEVARHEGIREVIPELCDIEGRIANIRVRVSGTIGGNLCFAEPHSDIATFSLLLDGQVGLFGPEGRRKVPLTEFIVGPYETARRMDEVMTHLDLDVPDADNYIGYERFAVHERPSATAGVRLIVDEAEGRIRDARVAIGCVGPNPHRVPAAEQLLNGCEVNRFDEVLVEAAETVARDVLVLEDLTGSEEYKRHLAGLLVERAGRQAWSKRQSGGN